MGLIKVAEISIDKLDDRKTVTAILHENGYTVGPGKRAKTQTGKQLDYYLKEIMEEPLEQYDKMLSPAVQFDFKNVTFTFLPHQVKDMDALVKDLESKAPDIVGVASYEQCKGFVETLSKYQKFTDIRNVGAAIHSMIENAAQKMDDCGFTEEGEWTYLAKLFGSNAVPGESASVIQQAIKKAEKEGTITSKNRWQLIEYLCADYLSGR